MKTEITCMECGEKLDETYNINPNKPCHKCNSTKQNITLTHNDFVETHDSLTGKVKDPTLPSKKKTRQEFFQGDDLRKSDGKWMRKERLIDKDNDKYKEVVIDPEDGSIVHHCEEPLSKHRGHGSDTKK